MTALTLKSAFTYNSRAKSQYTQVALWVHVPSAHHVPASLGFYLRGSFSSAQSDM